MKNPTCRQAEPNPDLKPNLQAMLTACAVFRVDRVCMVHPAEPAAPENALFCLALGDGLLQDAGAQLRAIFKDFSPPPKKFIQFDTETSFSVVIQAMQDYDLPWAWTDISGIEIKATLIICRGQVICDRVAAVLNQHHCPVSFK